MRTITKRYHETANQYSGIHSLEDYCKDCADLMQRTVVTAETKSEDVEDQEEVTNSEPSKDHVDCLIDEFDENLLSPGRSSLSRKSNSGIGKQKADLTSLVFPPPHASQQVAMDLLP